MSFADLERAPEDGRRSELYDGEVYVVPTESAVLPGTALRAGSIFP